MASRRFDGSTNRIVEITDSRSRDCDGELIERQPVPEVADDDRRQRGVSADTAEHRGIGVDHRVRSPVMPVGLSWLCSGNILLHDRCMPARTYTRAAHIHPLRAVFCVNPQDTRAATLSVSDTRDRISFPGKFVPIVNWPRIFVIISRRDAFLRERNHCSRCAARGVAI